MSEESLLSFPCDIPVKVLGRNAEAFRVAATDLVRSHYCDLGEAQLAEQLSSNGSFLSITFIVRAQSRDQVDALYRDLSASSDILMVL